MLLYIKQLEVCLAQSLHSLPQAFTLTSMTFCHDICKAFHYVLGAVEGFTSEPTEHTQKMICLTNHQPLLHFSLVTRTFNSTLSNI